MANRNFEVKHGLSVGGTERITAAGAGSLTDLTLSGNLTVTGSTVTLDAATLQVEDKNITLNYHASNDTSSTADGAGLTIQDAVNSSTNATLNWSAANDRFVMSHGLQVTSGNVNIDGTEIVDYSNKGKINLWNSASRTYALQMYHSGVFGSIGMTGNQILLLKTDDTQRIRITGPGTMYFYNEAGDSADFTWDATNSRVGIGTSSPLTPLDVVRGAATGVSSINARTALLVQNNNSAGTVLSINAPNTGYSGIFLGDPESEAQGQIKQVHTDNSMQFCTQGGATEMTLKDGDLGIGTTSPTYTLDVAGDIGVNEYIYHNDDTNTYMRFQTDSWLVRAGGDDRIYVDGTNGRVGIGTNSPAAELDVQGSTELFMTRTSSGLATYIENNGGYAALYLYQIGASPKVSIQANGSSYFNGGNVGIGTSSPQSGLHIAEGGSGSDGGSVLTLSQTGFGTIVNNDDLGSVHFGGVTSGGTGIHNAAKIMVEGDATWANNDYPTRMSFFTTADGASSANERMRIDSAGDINLVKAGTAQANLNFTTDGSLDYARITGGKSGSGVGDLRFFTYSGGIAERMRIDSSGNVDVKTGNIALTGSVDRRIKLSDSGVAGVSTSDNTVYIRANDDDLILNAAGNGITKFQYSGTERMRINASGCIGLNSTADRSLGTNIATTVTSGSAGSGFWMSTGNSSATSTKLISYQNGSVGEFKINQGSGVNGGSIIFSINDDEKMRINSNGKVGIDSTSANAKLNIENTATSFAIFAVNAANNYGVATLCHTHSSGTRYLMDFRVGGTAPSNQVGTITSNGSTTAYNTSSDYRLKENVDYTWDATTRLKQLKPARFNFKTDTDTLVDGFLAHEVQDIVPEAVTGEKDGEQMQGIDQSKLVPLMIKTIQELEARIATLEG